MKIYLTINDVRKLSEGKTLRCGDNLFRPSDKVKKICENMMKYEALMGVYVPVLESNWQVTSVYLQKVDRRRKVKK